MCVVSTENELKIWKENNKINIANQEIKDNLEPITSQEKPFNEVDNKYYFVVWRGDEKKIEELLNFETM